MKITRRSQAEIDLKIIVAQGEAILARLDLMNHKLEEAKKQREKEDRERD